MGTNPSDLGAHMRAGLRDRCVEILGELGPVEYHRGWEHFVRYDDGAVEQVALYPTPGVVLSAERIELAMYPGDTVAQARRFRDGVREREFLSLEEKGWRVRPNLHFSHIQKHLHWSQRRPPLDRYIEY